jgi:chromosome segregation ATPase
MSSPESEHFRQLEEKVSHLERELEHLQDEMKDIWKRLAAAESRLERFSKSQGEERPST